jgi:predicted amidohydrolase
MLINLLAVQLDSVWEDKQSNFAKVRSLLALRNPTPGSIIVLPEMFGTGFSCNTAMTVEADGGETQVFLQRLARDYQSCIVAGVVTQGTVSRGRNQALVIAPDGTLLARYTKIQPFSLGGESSVHERGTSPQIFEWQGVTIAPLICYDLRFPELARAAVKMGAEVLIYIAAWPVKRVNHWLTLLQARAIENQAYVIGVNRTGTEPSYSYNGRSVIINPQGVIIADAGEQEQVLRSEIDAQLVRDWRAEFPGLRDAGLIG